MSFAGVEAILADASVDFYTCSLYVHLTERGKIASQHSNQRRNEMANACDVARYILDRLAPDRYGSRLTAWKLQKLVYYSQAWSLVWDDAPLFDDEIQAWANGPVVPALYREHRGRFQLFAGDIPGNPENLTEDQRDTINVVLEFYGDKSPQWLSDLTHMEAPWRDARAGIPDGASSQRAITPEAMAAYYESLGQGE
ncbi:Panacea domain-containing protein [Sphingomonas adhaesiva]|uniref:Panacea domain-containing protein n=1 Tax=Sphingomonas adhaesiva TaxID=28212 RepID=UPI002FF51BBF